MTSMLWSHHDVLTSSWLYDVIMTLWRHHDVMTSLWRHHDVITSLCYVMGLSTVKRGYFGPGGYFGPSHENDLLMNLAHYVRLQWDFWPLNKVAWFFEDGKNAFSPTFNISGSNCGIQNRGRFFHEKSSTWYRKPFLEDERRDEVKWPLNL